MNNYFRPIKGYPAYRIGATGEVQSSWRRKGVVCSIGDTWKPLKQINRHGYHHVALAGGGTKKIFSVHRLVLEQFVGPCPEGMVGCHCDGNPANNCLNNLRWDTPKANSDDKLLHGTMCRGEAARHAKLREHDVLEIRRLRSEGHSTSSLADRFEVSVRNIRTIVSGRSWRHLLSPEERPAPQAEGVGLRGAA